MNEETIAVVVGFVQAAITAVIIVVDARKFSPSAMKEKRGPAIFLAFAIGPLVWLPWCVQTRGWKRGGFLALLGLSLLFALYALLDCIV